jgi:acyl-CoA thioester hydrolase
VAEPFRHTMRVRYAECDALGVVFNAHYLMYLDQTMTELFREAMGGYRRLIENELDMVVADVQMRFLAPARFDEEIELEVTVTHIGTTSLITHHRIRRSTELLFEADMVHVWVRRGSAQKTPLPAWARDGLQPWYDRPAPDGAKAG